MAAKVKLVGLKCDNERPGRATPVPIIGLNEGGSALIGKWMLIGKPVSPDGTWKCGTDVVWPILNAEFFERIPQGNEIPYVCRHMIDAGD